MTHALALWIFLSLAFGQTPKNDLVSSLERVPPPAEKIREIDRALLAAFQDGFNSLTRASAKRLIDARTMQCPRNVKLCVDVTPWFDQICGLNDETMENLLQTFWDSVVTNIGTESQVRALLSKVVTCPNSSSRLRLTLYTLHSSYARWPAWAESEFALFAQPVTPPNKAGPSLAVDLLSEVYSWRPTPFALLRTMAMSLTGWAGVADQDLRIKLAEIMMNAGEFKRTESLLKPLLNSPNSPDMDIIEIECVAARALGRPAQCLDLLERYPNASSTLRGDTIRTLIQMEEGRPSADKFAELLARAIKQGDDAAFSLSVHLANALYWAGRMREAKSLISKLQESNNLMPRSLDKILRSVSTEVVLAKILRREGNLSAARTKVEAQRAIITANVTGPFLDTYNVLYESLCLALAENNTAQIESAAKDLLRSLAAPDDLEYYALAARAAIAKTQGKAYSALVRAMITTSGAKHPGYLEFAALMETK